MKVFDKGALLFAAAVILLVAAAGPVAAATRTPTAIKGVKSEYTAAKLTVTGKLVRKSGARWVALPGKYVVFSKYEGSKLVRIDRLKTNAAGKFTVPFQGGVGYQLAFKADVRYVGSAVKVAVAGPTTPGACADCHTSLEALTASASQGVDPAKELVKSDFVASRHDSKGCWACHKGDPLASGKDAAHDGMVVDPVADGGTAACGQCHSDDVATHKTSLHYTTNGLKNSFFGRLKNCPEQAQQSWRSKACVDCHASCGTCHVARPRDPWMQSGPKGLLDGPRLPVLRGDGRREEGRHHPHLLRLPRGVDRRPRGRLPEVRRAQHAADQLRHVPRQARDARRRHGVPDDDRHRSGPRRVQGMPPCIQPHRP